MEDCKSNNIKRYSKTYEDFYSKKEPFQNEEEEVEVEEKVFISKNYDSNKSISMNRTGSEKSKLE
jgi:hypothetical protein